MKLFRSTLILIISAFLFSNISSGSELSNNKAAKIYAHFLELINKNSKNQISNKEVLKTSISSVLKEFDDNSYFIDEYAYQKLSEAKNGYFYGIGISLEYRKGVYVINEVVKNSPADKVGLSKNDIVLEMEGFNLTTATVSQALASSNAKNKKTVEIVVKETKTNIIKKFNILKQTILINNIEFIRKERNLYIKIKSFNENIVRDIKSIVSDPDNQEVQGYIIDLRDNLGGLLNQAVGLVDLILDEGIIVSIDYKKPKPGKVFYAKKGNIFNKKKIIILVNQKSASASEIVASALQDHKRALIMGEKTYGKTTVQQLYPLDGVGAAAITIAKYYRPNGSALTGGITPDIITNMKLKSSKAKPEHDQLLKLAFSKLENKLG